MEETQVKLILLKTRSEYLIGRVTQLDEEPSCLIENHIAPHTHPIPYPSTYELRGNAHAEPRVDRVQTQQESSSPE
jgi:hypothetical protein